MGARLSQPTAPGGTTESSRPAKPPPPPTPKRPFPRQINSRTIVAPVAAFTMACILFVYSRTSIRAAKANAQRYREADSGGEGVSLMREHRRRHGLESRLEGGTVGELGREVRAQVFGVKSVTEGEKEGREGRGGGLSQEEETLRAFKGGRGGRGRE